MVTFVDDHVVKVGGPEAFEQPSRSEALNCSEDVLIGLGAVAIDQQLTEGTVLHGMAERVACLQKDLLPMGKEQQSGTRTRCGGDARIVTRGDDSLAGARGGNDEVSAAPVKLALDP